MKVYCLQCKYFNEGCSDRHFENCNAPANREQKEYENHRAKWVGPIALSPAEKNQHNNCCDYEARQ